MSFKANYICRVFSDRQNNAPTYPDNDGEVCAHSLSTLRRRARMNNPMSENGLVPIYKLPNWRVPEE
jgi:hypothetical protein